MVARAGGSQYDYIAFDRPYDYLPEHADLSLTAAVIWSLDRDVESVDPFGSFTPNFEARARAFERTKLCWARPSML